MQQRVPMTPEGYKAMQTELEKLLKVERPKNVQDIAEARAHGDLSENAEYHAAKERQSFIEGRVRELQDKVARAQVIDSTQVNHEKVAFGAKVTVLDLASDIEYDFRIVGSEEADLKKGSISLTSPVGKALMGKTIGDTALIQAPAKTIEYEIMGIVYE